MKFSEPKDLLQTKYGPKTIAQQERSREWRILDQPLAKVAARASWVGDEAKFSLKRFQRPQKRLNVRVTLSPPPISKKWYESSLAVARDSSLKTPFSDGYYRKFWWQFYSNEDTLVVLLRNLGKNT